MTESQFQGMKMVLLVKAMCIPSPAFWFSVECLCRFSAHLVCLLPREMTGQFERAQRSLRGSKPAWSTPGTAYMPWPLFSSFCLLEFCLF